VKIINRQFKHALFAVATCLFAACSTQAPLPIGHGVTDAHRALAIRVHAKRELRVLFVGNSYSFGAPKEFAKLAKSHGHRVHVDQSTYSRWSLRRHADSLSTRQLIREGNWDIVVFQEFSETPALPPGKCAARMFPALRELVVVAREHGAIPVLYQTWGRRDGSGGLAGDDFHAMTQRIRMNYRAASEAVGKIVVVPVGDAWEREVLAGNGPALFIADGSHPSAKGNRLTASVFEYTIFGKW